MYYYCVPRHDISQGVRIHLHGKSRAASLITETHHSVHYIIFFRGCCRFGRVEIAVAFILSRDPHWANIERRWHCKPRNSQYWDLYNHRDSNSGFIQIMLWFVVLSSLYKLNGIEMYVRVVLLMICFHSGIFAKSSYACRGLNEHIDHLWYFFNSESKLTKSIGWLPDVLPGSVFRQWLNKFRVTGKTVTFVTSFFPDRDLTQP